MQSFDNVDGSSGGGKGEKADDSRVFGKITKKGFLLYYDNMYVLVMNTMCIS